VVGRGAYAAVGAKAAPPLNCSVAGIRACIGIRPASAVEMKVAADVLHTTWLDPALVLPQVTKWKTEGVAEALEGRFAHLRTSGPRRKPSCWRIRLLGGLNFKPWPKDGLGRYSVRVDANFRAHLEHLGDGRWVAYDLGPHTKLGHG
jgi:hypothetical protein